MTAFVLGSRIALFWVPIAFTSTLAAQCDAWQQRVEYTMRVELDHATHRYTGRAELRYFNNSPDTLDHVFFHLYPNAFKPGSEMDVRSRTIADPDARIGGRIAELAPEQEGDLHVNGMTQDGAPVHVTEMGTIEKVALARALLPGKNTTFRYGFTGQVPVQIRRSGRNNAEGVAYSMSQWYPKIAAYDERGWHATPYVAREFYGVWGDFDVTITMDAAFVVAASGVDQGSGSSGNTGSQALAGTKVDRRFKARNVHDFAWAADRDFIHTTDTVPGGPVLHFFRKQEDEFAENWNALPGYMIRCFQYMDEHFGKYPWPQFSYVQGGDGGMEYPMMTLISGHRGLGSLVGTSVHETVHSWYYGVLANDEGSFPWLDEGLAEYAGSKVMQELFPRPEDPHASAYAGYWSMVNGDHEPPSVHADHFRTNRTYSGTAYNFGEVFINQLGAVIGERELATGLLRYFDACAFKHPDPVDLERAMEKQSGLELGWYFDEWINTTRTADYGIRSVLQVDGEVRIELERIGDQLMPVDLELVHRDGMVERYHIPLSLSNGVKRAGSEADPFTPLPAWQWTNRTYSFALPGSIAQLRAIALDPLQRVADIDRTNDRVDLPGSTEGFIRP
ncbi:MAG: M1 family metallopeptidase [Flavobacteriales bacterium]